MKTSETVKSARERILDTACDLFYRQGYRATGINQVIAESGIAKATFYKHFPAKEDLLVAYLREMSRREIAEMREEVYAFPTTRERLFAPLMILRPWFESTDFRGCPFQNAVAEVPSGLAAMHQVLGLHRAHEWTLFHELLQEYLTETAPGAEVDLPALTETYMLLFEGAIALASSYRQVWPVERAEEALGRELARIAPG